MVVAALLALGLTTAPPADITSAARRLAPPGAHVVLAEERDWRRGVAAWDDGRTVTTVGLIWRGDRWQPARPSGRAVVIGRSRPRLTGRDLYLEIHVAIRTPLMDEGVWLDGRPADVTFFPGPGRDIAAVIAGRLPAGRHVIVAYAATPTAATTRSWTVRVR